MAAIIQSPTWNNPADAGNGLAPLLDGAGGASNVLVKLDAANLAHHDNDPAYRLARYVADSSAVMWYDARIGLRLYNVVGWQIAQ